MKFVEAALPGHELYPAARDVARAHGTTVESMFQSESRENRAARAAFLAAVHDPKGWTVDRLADLVGRSKWTVHSAVYHAPRQRPKVRRWRRRRAPKSRPQRREPVTPRSQEP